MVNHLTSVHFIGGLHAYVNVIPGRILSHQTIHLMGGEGLMARGERISRQVVDRKPI
jgi:hypothetical protein